MHKKPKQRGGSGGEKVSCFTYPRIHFIFISLPTSVDQPVKLSVDNEFEWFFYDVVISEPRSYRAFSWADSAPIRCWPTALWQLRVRSFDLFCNPFRSFLGAFSHFRLHMLSLRPPVSGAKCECRSTSINFLSFVHIRPRIPSTHRDIIRAITIISCKTPVHAVRHSVVYLSLR